MHDLVLLFTAAWRVLVVALLLGAGLPTLFALGVRLMAHGIGGAAEAGAGEHPRHPLFVLLGGVCFTVVGLAIALGLTIIVASGFGKVVSFDQGWPVVVDRHR